VIRPTSNLDPISHHLQGRCQVFRAGGSRSNGRRPRGGRVWRGGVPLPRNFFDFFLQNGAFWRSLKGFTNNAQLMLRTLCCLQLSRLKSSRKDSESRKNVIIHYNHCKILIAPVRLYHRHIVTRSRCQAMTCNAMNAACAPAGFLRATARCFARLSRRRGARPSVCHTLKPCQNNAS